MGRSSKTTLSMSFLVKKEFVINTPPHILLNKMVLPKGRIALSWMPQEQCWPNSNLHIIFGPKLLAPLAMLPTVYIFGRVEQNPLRDSLRPQTRHQVLP